MVRLPQEARQQLINEERNVSVAENNLQVAQVAEKEARDFQSIVENERKAAREGLEAARKSVELGRKAGHAETTQEGNYQLTAAEARAATLDAKGEYAKELVALRAALVEQRKAEIDAAKAELEAAKVSSLAAEGQQGNLDRSKFDSQAAEARKRAVEMRARGDAKRGDVEARKAAWQALRGKHVAKGGESDVGAVDAPPPPEPLETPVQ